MILVVLTAQEMHWWRVNYRLLLLLYKIQAHRSAIVWVALMMWTTVMLRSANRSLIGNIKPCKYWSTCVYCSCQLLHRQEVQAIPLVSLHLIQECRSRVCCRLLHTISSQVIQATYEDQRWKESGQWQKSKTPYLEPRFSWFEGIKRKCWIMFLFWGI